MESLKKSQTKRPLRWAIAAKGSFAFTLLQLEFYRNRAGTKQLRTAVIRLRGADEEREAAAVYAARAGVVHNFKRGLRHGDLYVTRLICTE